MVFTSHDRPGQQDLNGLDLQLEGFSAAPKASIGSGELLLGRIYTQRRVAKEREKQGSLAVPRLYRLECYRDAMERRAGGRWRIVKCKLCMAFSLRGRDLDPTVSKRIATKKWRRQWTFFL